MGPSWPGVNFQNFFKGKIADVADDAGCGLRLEKVDQILVLASGKQVRQKNIAENGVTAVARLALLSGKSLFPPFHDLTTSSSKLLLQLVKLTF